MTSLARTSKKLAEKSQVEKQKAERISAERKAERDARCAEMAARLEEADRLRRAAAKAMVDEVIL